ncbi:MAG: YeeE/YedE family protein [Anaerolineales bacterium]|nr:YeeE/YedE family protein [Anaerolineales bacterium]
MTAILSGLLVGLLFGFALQRGRFCMNSAIRDTVLLQDNTLLKSVGIAVLVQMFGFAIMAAANIITISPKPLFWGAQLIGGFVFGIGMVLAGGCASGVTYRVGEGMLGAVSAVIGLSIGATLTAMGFLKPIMTALQENTKVTMADGSAPTLANILGLEYVLVALILAVAAGVVWYLMARRSHEVIETGSGSLGKRIFKKGWSWLPTGIAIGLIGMLAFYSSAQAGTNYPLRITSGWVTLVKLVLPGVDATINWDAYLILGIIFGALIASLIAGEFKFRFPGWITMAQTFLGGLLMGFGAVTSGGCNVTHILSGVPQLSIGSILGGISIVLGGWTMAYFMFIRPMKSK